MKPVGEPDAGNRHVRFDERGWETERCRMAQATAPILDSTRGVPVPARLHEINKSLGVVGMHVREEDRIKLSNIKVDL